MDFDFVRRINAEWHDLMEKKGDPRVADWPLMSSPLPTISIVLSYIYIVKVLGPRLMENRKPFKLRNVLIVYNFMHVLISIYIWYEGGMAGWFGKYNWRCEAFNPSTDEATMRMTRVAWVYYFSKFPELFDTIFFVMRKRYDQVSNLHVIHHGAMPFAVWWGVKFVPTGHLTFFGFFNAFVHIVMYTYYMMAAIGPEMQKYLWWKKYLTTFQMIQFVCVFIHAIQLLFYNPCNYPLVFVYVVMLMALMFFVLFAGFYQKAYKNDKNTPKKVKKKISGDFSTQMTQISNGFNHT